MKVALPSRAERAEVCRLLADFYAEHDERDFAQAWRRLCSWYQIAAPRVRWRKRIDRGWTLGLTHSNNVVELIHPRWFAQHDAPWNTEARWILVVLHELYHAVHYIDEEAKADAFAGRFAEV